MPIDCITAAQAAEQWGVSLRQVQRLLRQGRIPGAQKYGAAWTIPSGSRRPADLRRAREAEAEPPLFTLPRQCPALIMTTLYQLPGGGDAAADSLAGDPAAQKLFAAQLSYFRGEPELAARLAGELLMESGAPDVRLGCGFVLCLSAMYAGDADA